MFDQQSDVTRYVSINVSLFKCKPTTMNVPGQFLITIPPPVCICNYLFSDLTLLSSSNESLGVAETKGFFYLNELKFEELEYGKGSTVNVNWRFNDDSNGFYTTQKEQPLFVPKKLPKGKAALLSNQTCQI